MLAVGGFLLGQFVFELARPSAAASVSVLQLRLGGLRVAVALLLLLGEVLFRERLTAGAARLLAGELL